MSPTDRARRRVIPLDRQSEIKQCLNEMRERAWLLRTAAARSSNKTDEEMRDLLSKIAVLEGELKGFLDELKGHGPAHLMDRCIHLLNFLIIPKADIRDVQSPRK